jgi:small-conductance mechanosensitive channel
MPAPPRGAREARHRIGSEGNAANAPQEDGTPMELLNTVYFDNTLRVWLIALGIVVASWLILSLAKRLIVRRLQKFAETTATDVDDLFVELIRRTGWYFLLAVSLYAASQTMRISDPVRDMARIFGILTLLFQSAVWGNGIIAYTIARMARQRLAEGAAGTSTLTAVGFVMRVLLWSVILILALDNLGFNITTLIAGLGIGGIAVALAMQNVLGDLFASLSIVLDKPFEAGDFIVVDSVQGTVDRIGLKTTRLRSLSGEEIIMANADLLKSRIRNYKRMQERRAVFTVGLTYATPPETVARVPAMLREVITAQADARFDRAHFQSFGESALLFEAVYYVRKPDYAVYMDVQQQINLEVLRRCAAEGISFAFPTRTIHVSPS